MLFSWLFWQRAAIVCLLTATKLINFQIYLLLILIDLWLLPLSLLLEVFGIKITVFFVLRLVPATVPFSRIIGLT